MSDIDESKRANRIYERIEGHHQALNSLYEYLVDRDLDDAERCIRYIIFDLKLLSKAIKNENF